MTRRAVIYARVSSAGDRQSTERQVGDRLNSGRELAKSRGIRMGRPAGTKMSLDAILAKYPEVVKRLGKGQSVRDIAKRCGVSPATVRRVKEADILAELIRSGRNDIAGGRYTVVDIDFL